mmetsp:Transcript_38501/g.69111  ORF Transcript_38501/g.69111 Transcript_38501/m.69111 type:complete len:204 (-) Transcript_38501:3707-4318(-)
MASQVRVRARGADFANLARLAAPKPTVLLQRCMLPPQLAPPASHALGKLVSRAHLGRCRRRRQARSRDVCSSRVGLGISATRERLREGESIRQSGLLRRRAAGRCGRGTCSLPIQIIKTAPIEAPRDLQRHHGFITACPRGRIPAGSAPPANATASSGAAHCIGSAGCRGERGYRTAPGRAAGSSSPALLCCSRAAASGTGAG